MTDKHIQDPALSPKLGVEPDQQLLFLPRASGSDESPANALRKILGMDAVDQRGLERRLLLLLEVFYPEVGTPVSDEAKRAIKLLGNWLSNQDAANRLNIEDPDSAAHFFISMTFGGLAASRKLGQPLPGGERLISHFHQAISLFVRGLAIPSA